MNIDNVIKHLNELKIIRPKYKKIIDKHKKIIILGNGGSSAIASHITEDYTKALNKKSFTFSDSAMLTCFANDYGWELAYLSFLKKFYEKNSLVILISSSGKSKNILNCAEFCEKCDLPFITLSGFDINNPLNTNYPSSLLNYHVNSIDYGEIECLHELFLHSII